MSAQPTRLSFAHYIAREGSNADPERVVNMLRALTERLAANGLTLEQVVNDALNPHRRLAQMPSQPLSKKTWRAWTVYLLARRDELSEKDATHLRVCFLQRKWLATWQMRWIYDIVARIEPAGCGTWGAPV